MRNAAWLILLSTCFATSAIAQAPTPLPAGAPTASGSGAPTAPVPLPAPPTIDDPMLLPVPPASRNIATWEEALSFVRARSTDLRIAVDEVLRAEAQTRTALGGLLTQINGNAVATHNFITETTPSQPPSVQALTPTVGGNPLVINGQPVVVNVAIPGSPGFTVPKENYLNAGITAVQPIFNAAAYDAYRVSKLNESVGRLSIEDLKRTLALNVANEIVGVVTAERVAELNRVGLRQALERLDLTKRKQALGVGTGLDVIRGQQDAEAARATLVSGDESLLEAREALGLALGLPEAVGVSRDVSIDGLEQSALHVCRVSDSLDQRADVAAARERLDVAKRNVNNVYLQFLPTLNAQSTVATTTNDVLPQTTWNIQAVLQVPIWDGGMRYGALRQARAAEDESVQQLEALRRTATIQIAQARRGVEVAEASRMVAANARALAAEADRLTQVAYRAGQLTSLDLVLTAAALRQAEISLALQDFSVVRARILAVLALATCPW